MNKEKHVHLRPRLAAVAELFAPTQTIADIGCDHGRLSVGLLQRGIAKQIIASEISAPSLNKARALCSITGMQANIVFRVGDGLSVLHPGEADALALCGMGGALMAQILNAAPQPLLGAKRVVLQPMRGISDIRRYAYTHGLRIERDVIAMDQKRMYQVFSAVPGQEDALPAGWPEDCFLLGFRAMGDPLFESLALSMLAQCERSLAEARNTHGEARLSLQAAQLTQIVSLL